MSGLWLRSLACGQFRSHERVRLALDARPVAIYGPNGAGKTNLIEAVSMLSPGRGLRRASAADMARTATAVGWRVTSEVSSLGRVHEIETSSDRGAARTVKVDGKATSQLALGNIVRIVWLIPAMDRLWIEGAEGRRRFLDRMVLSFEPGHGEAVLNYEKAMRDRNRLLREQVDDPGWYAALEQRMSAAGAQIIANRRSTLARISEAQTGAETEFPAADLSISGPDGAEDQETEAELLSAYAAGRRTDLASGRTLVGPHRADLEAIYATKGLAARNCSTGEQKALLLSLILSNARALQEDFGAPPLLLLDEVAAHLDRGRRAALYDEISALGAQAWMTGTGSEMFQDLGDRTQRIEVTEERGTSLIAQVD